MDIRRAGKADVGGIAHVHVDSWRETYRGILPQDFLESLSYERLEKFWAQRLAGPQDPSKVYVLSPPTQEVVGFVGVGPERGNLDAYDGELYAIYLLAEHHRKGWGKKLFMRGAAALYQEGYGSMALWVLKDNPTRGFYEHLGGKVVGEQIIEIGDKGYLGVAYAWEELQGVVKSS